MKFIDLFAGAGGFRRGLEKANGFECVWSCEIDKYCQAVYRHHWKEVEAGDVKLVDPSAIPDFDLLCAGFPCQGFSIAGKRKGFADDRGTLFFDIARIVEVKRPPLLLLENVKGLLSHDEGRTYGRILSVLDDLGYWVEWQVLDSQDFGVPQHRERVFIVGHLGEAGGREIFPIGEISGNDFQGDEEAEGREVTNTLTGGYSTQNARGTYIAGETPMIGHSVRSGGRGSLDRHTWDIVIEENPTIFKKHMKEIRTYQDVVPGLRQRMGTGGGNVPMVMHCLTPDRAEKRQHGRRFKEAGEPMFTLTGQDVHGVCLLPAVTHKRPFMGSAPKPKDIESEPCFPLQTRGGYDLAIHTGKSTVEAEKDGDKDIYAGYTRIRRLTPIECERLQGFPDDWTRWGVDEKGNKIELSDTQRYKMMGNAVTVNVIEFLGRLLKGTGSG